MTKQEVVLAAAAGAGAALAASALLQYLRARSAAAAAAADAAEVSTTSSSHSGNVYETDKAVAEYLMFHFGEPAALLPYAVGPHDALDFASRTAALCVHWARKLGVPLSAAFDVGCSVGRTTFDLSADFGVAVGLDFSHAFVAAANRLKEGGSLGYRMTEEGEVTSEHVAKLPPAARAARCAFIQGDACALPPNADLAALGVPDGGRFSVIHGANLLCRLPEPTAFLRRLPSLLVPGGLVVFVSPYSWLKQYTPKDKWLGGYIGKDGKACSSWDGLRAEMEALGFALVHEEQVPFLIREHARKFQWGCSHGTVWQLKGKGASQ